MALRCFKARALWGKDAESKDDHGDKVWQRVLAACKAGSLPEMEELDAAPPVAWT